MKFNNIRLGRLQQPRKGTSDYIEQSAMQRVSIVRQRPPTQEYQAIGYNRPQWLHKMYMLWRSTYDNVNKPYDSELGIVSRQVPKTSAPLNALSWVASINQVNIPRNRFIWHPVAELQNLPVAGGNAQTVQQQYVMVQPSEALVAGLLNASRMVPRSQTPVAYGQPLATVSDTGVIVKQVARLTPTMQNKIAAQADSGSNFFRWLRMVFSG